MKLKKSDLSRIVSVLKEAKRNDLAEAMLGTPQMKPKQVIRKNRIRENPYYVCPHCKQEFAERGGMFMKGKDNPKWFCGTCKNEVVLPEPDYTELGEGSINILSPEQKEILKQQLKEKSGTPKGIPFFFKVVVWDKDNFNFCHSKCPYFKKNPKKPYEAICSLFGGVLLKNRGKFPPFWARNVRCVKAVEASM